MNASSVEVAVAVAEFVRKCPAFVTTLTCASVEKLLASAKWSWEPVAFNAARCPASAMGQSAAEGQPAVAAKEREAVVESAAKYHVYAVVHVQNAPDHLADIVVSAKDHHAKADFQVAVQNAGSHLVSVHLFAASVARCPAFARACVASARRCPAHVDQEKREVFVASVAECRVFVKRRGSVVLVAVCLACAPICAPTAPDYHACAIRRPVLSAAGFHAYVR